MGPGLSETSFRLRSEKAGQYLLTNQLVVEMFAHLQKKSDAHSCLSHLSGNSQTR
jgi:hypothetical protein